MILYMIAFVEFLQVLWHTTFVSHPMEHGMGSSSSNEVIGLKYIYKMSQIHVYTCVQKFHSKCGDW